MKFLSLLLAIASTFLSLSAQQPPAAAKGRITGRILDFGWPKSCGIRHDHPLCGRQYTASQWRCQYNKGVFTVDGTSSGQLYATIGFIGYRPAPSAPLHLDAKTNEPHPGRHLLIKKSEALQAVTVTASKGLVENKIE